MIFDVAPANAHAVTTVALEAVIATSSHQDVVLLCRLPWPEGTVVINVAPANAHAVTAAALKVAIATSS